MIVISITVDTDDTNIIGIKEDLAMICERYGDVRKIDVKAVEPQQMRFGGL